MRTRSRGSAVMATVAAMLAGAVLLVSSAPAATKYVSKLPPAGTIELYKPNYIVYDETRGDNWQLKFQTSVRMNLVPVARLYLGFTQESYWDLGQDSAPFREHDFNPELFLKFERHPADTLLTTLFDHVRRAQLGVEHQSTGVAGVHSRGWNLLYANLRFDLNGLPWIPLDERAGSRLSVYPRLWIILNRSKENRDIVKYTGFGSPVECGANMIIALRIENRVRTAVEFGKRYAQVEVGVRPGASQNFHFHGRYWSGYGEGLIGYDRFSRSFGLGISFIKD
jgi:phospholipase A1/A2